MGRGRSLPLSLSRRRCFLLMMPDYGGAGDDTAKDIKSTAAVGVIYNNLQSYRLQSKRM